MTVNPLRREIYGPVRAKELRWLMYTSLIAGLVLLLMALIGFANSDRDFGIYVGVPALTLTGFTIAALIHLRRRFVMAKVLCTMTGVLLVVTGLVLLQIAFGLSALLLGTGVWTIVVAVRRDSQLTN
jgi:hypothetical protein